MTDNNIFTLAQIIGVAGTNPGDITTTVWEAGYRKPVKTPEEAALLTIDLMYEFCDSNTPREYWPKNYDDILSGELNRFIEDASWLKRGNPGSIARAIIVAGYRKEPINDR